MTDGVRQPARPATAPAIGPEMQHALEQEVAKALQPTLTGFRRQAAQTVRQEVDRALRIERAPDRREAPPAPPPDRVEGQGSRPPVDGERRTVAGLTERAFRHVVPSGSGPAVSAVAGSALGAVPTVLEQQGERWLRSRLEVGRDALCSEPVRAAIRHQTEHVLRPFLLTRRTTAAVGVVRRARIVLLAADGVPLDRIAREVGVRRNVVRTWVDRYRADGLDGLRDRPRPGRPRTFSP